MLSPVPTPHEIQVLESVLEHRTVGKAANHLCLSPHTVDEHIDRLRRRSGLHTIAQIVAWALVNGWLNYGPDFFQKLAESG